MATETTNWTFARAWNTIILRTNFVLGECRSYVCSFVRRNGKEEEWEKTQAVFAREIKEMSCKERTTKFLAEVSLPHLFTIVARAITACFNFNSLSWKE